MHTRIAILLPYNHSMDVLSQWKVLMESWRSLKKHNPTNRSNPREVPGTKIERTISLQLIYTYGVDDPVGLRRPDLGATGVERREDQPFWDMVVFRSNEREGG